MLKQEAIKTWKLSLPIILGEVTQMSLGLIDSAMVGAISYKQLAAAALVNSVLTIPFVFGIGLTMSISQKVALAHGRRDGQQVSHYLFNGFLLCTLGAVFISLCLEFGKNILYHLGQDADVARLAEPFLRIVSISLIPSLMFIALKQFTDGLEKTRTAMMLSLLSMPLNVFLNWMLIYGHFGFPRLELVGAALGTLITRTIILVTLILIVCFHPTFRRYILVRKNQWNIRWQSIKDLLGIGVPSALQAVLEAGAFAVSAILVGTLGAVSQAAHQIALQCAALTFMVSLGLAQGSAIRIGNAFGRKNWDEINHIGKSTFYSGLLYGLCCAILFIIFRKQLSLIFNADVHVVLLASTLMIFAAVFQISDATQAIAVGCLRGINDVKVPTIYMAIAYWIVGVPAGCLLAFTFHFGASGIWVGFVIGLSAVSILLNKRFNKMIAKKF
ncbi:MATE family efflux transporter [Arachidicoccus ginsenosidimutans]|uniref:MATE family efflux transporter n=1 Tax=Arachidicoccus sp. BS20 TaxID=1850526 RepID=UPI0007F143D8|nr:MATE family efflux transporter [Arachidicoccus sp. BS20]ANI88461.1 MATE family efflux transporter [Arachidicoccus sp. BS20]